MRFVAVCEAQCRRVAEVLAVAGVPAAAEHPTTKPTAVEFDLATLNLILVTVCHQTQRLQGEVSGQQLAGWDYLRTSLTRWANQDPTRLELKNLARLSGDSFSHAIGRNAFAQTDAQHRAWLIRDCASKMLDLGVLTFSDVFARCHARINVGAPCLLSTLAEFQAFQDPVRKKSMYLLGLNAATCGWQYADPESLLPPVDYHEVRGHLRLGTVLICDKTLRETVMKHQPVQADHDVAIRRAVSEAILSISELSKISPMDLHYLFWNLFRNLCVRDSPCCTLQVSVRIPSSYHHLILDKGCPFQPFCDSANMPRAINEHVFATDWY